MKKVVVAFCVIALVFINLDHCYSADDEDQGPVIPPSKCEVCKFLAIELKDRLEETGKTKEVLTIGHGLDPAKKKKIKYNTAELRLIEALNDPHICEKILEYNIHKERSGSNRFAKGQSETFETLHGLVNKGVKVDLGIPYELWDKPSAEVTHLQRECFNVVEKYEEDIEEWYFSNQDKDIMDYLCRDRVLKNKDQSCLDEVYEPKGDNGIEEEEKPTKTKPKKKKSKVEKKGDNGVEGEEKTPKKNKSKGKQKGDKGDRTEL